MAPYAYQAFAGSLGNAFLPNFNDLYRDYANNSSSMLGEYANRSDGNQQAYTDYAAKAMDDYSAANDEYWRLMNGAQNEFKTNTNNLLGEYNRRMDGYLGDYTGAEQSALGQYEGSMGSAKGNYDAAVGKRQGAWDDLVNGVLPSQYASNRQAALNADLRGTVGSAINNLASRGVINSSVGNKAMDDISQSASDTLAKRYADDLSLEASLLGQDRSNARSDYDVASGNAGNLYTNRTGSARSIYDNSSSNANGQFGNYLQTYQNQYGNSTDAYNRAMQSYGDVYKTRANTAGDWFNNVNRANDNVFGAALGEQGNLFDAAIKGQSASLDVPNQMLSYAGQLTSPVSNLYNTMYSGRMGTGSTTTTQSDGGSGMWSAVGGLGSAMIMCFHGNTLVTTPKGYKAIRNVQVGDEVLSVHEGEVVPKKVTAVIGPTRQAIIDVYFENGTVWHTTKGQRYFDGTHFGYVEHEGEPALVYNGNKTHILEVRESGKTAMVYDLTLEGFAGENVFFANDVAAEGFGD
jgi:hypothetical protein